MPFSKNHQEITQHTWGYTVRSWIYRERAHGPGPVVLFSLESREEAQGFQGSLSRLKPGTYIKI